MSHPVCTRVFACSLVFLACLLSPATCVPTANVTLRTFTIAKQYSWFMNPNFYIVCGTELRIYLTDVKKAGQLYEFSGNETWQPVAKLSEGECQLCSAGEQMWFEYRVHAMWMVCEANFSRDPRRRFDPYARLHLEGVKGAATVDLSCAECTREQDMAYAPEGAPSTQQSSGIGVFFWIFASATVLGVSISLITVMIFVTKGPETMMDENERQKFIEMNSSHALEDTERQGDLRGEREKGGHRGGHVADVGEEEMVQIIHEPREGRRFSDILREDNDSIQ